MGILIAVQSVTLGLPGSGTGEDLCPFLLAASSPGQWFNSIRRRIAPGGPHRDGTNRRREPYQKKSPGDRHENCIARAYPLPSTPPFVVHVRNSKTRFQVAPNTL